VCAHKVLFIVMLFSIMSTLFDGRTFPYNTVAVMSHIHLVHKTMMIMMIMMIMTGMY
jgi:hypothetical protein